MFVADVSGLMMYVGIIYIFFSFKSLTLNQVVKNFTDLLMSMCSDKVTEVTSA